MRRIVVVGASLAGVRAVEALRRKGFTGEITWLGAEPHAPYDRPPLSKEVLRGEWEPARLALRKESYDALGVDLRLSTRASGLDLAGRCVLVDGEALPFDGLVIATGARARTLPSAQGLGGVHVLRTLEDGLNLRDALRSKPRVAVIGAGFIGAEVVSSARTLGLDVTVIEALPVPLSPVLGERMGQVCAELHRAHGVTLKTGVGVSGLEGEGRVERVRLLDGTCVEAEVVVVGIGVIPNTDWLQGSGLDITDGVACDATCTALRSDGSRVQGIVAAGDVARFFNPLYGESMRVEHFTHAVEQAEHAVDTLLGAEKPFETAPLFWSDQYGIKIQFAGRARPGDALHVCHGTPEERRFVALYGREGRLVGALTFRRPAQLIKYRGLIEQRAAFDEVVAATSV
jgi:NADPH-dependent 2,4-dienoyl-CoA reductase/sulfur reductase-like enzyme